MYMSRQYFIKSLTSLPAMNKILHVMPFPYRNASALLISGIRLSGPEGGRCVHQIVACLEGMPRSAAPEATE